MLKRFLQFIRSPFARSTVTLQAGSLGAMAVQAAAAIVLARLLGPERFGTYALAFSVAMVASVLLGAGAYDAMIPHISRAWVGGERTQVRPLMAYLLKFVVIVGALALLVGLFLPAFTAQAYGDARIGWYALVILAAAAVSTVFFESAKLAAQVTGRITTLSWLTFGDHASRFSWAIGLVLAGMGVTGAVTGHLFGAVMLGGIAAFVFARIARHEDDWPSFRRIVGSARHVDLKPYLSDTLWVMGDRNLAMLYAALPVALVGLFVPTQQVAFFKVAFGYIVLALAVLGPVSVLLNVQFPKIQVSAPERLGREFVRVSLFATALSAAVTVGVVLLAPYLFPFLYGSEYDAAIPLVRGFAVHGIFFGIGVGLGPMWRALSRVRVSILINLLTLGFGVPLGLYVTNRWGIWGGVVMVTLWYLVSHGASFIYLVRALNKRYTEPRV